MAETELEPALYDAVIEALKDVIDPEIGVNIVDLGLIYGLQKSEDGNLLINMTLTSAGCPLTDVLEEQTAESLDGVVEAFRINWVWMRWSSCQRGRPGTKTGPSRLRQIAWP